MFAEVGFLPLEWHFEEGMIEELGRSGSVLRACLKAVIQEVDTVRRKI